MGSDEYDAASAVALDSAGRVVVAGWLGGAVDFGQGAFETAHDAFVAWIEP